MSDQTQTPRTIFRVINAVMRDVGVIGKNKRNEMQKFNFRGIDDVLNSLHGPMVEHGLTVMPMVIERWTETRTTSSGGTLNVAIERICYTFYDLEGDSVTATVDAEAQDSGDKATGKVNSAGYKTAMLQVFCIPTQDLEDADASGTEAAPARGQAPQRQQPQAVQPAAARPVAVVPQPPATAPISKSSEVARMKNWLNGLGVEDTEAAALFHIQSGGRVTKDMSVADVTATVNKVIAAYRTYDQAMAALETEQATA